MSDKRTIRAVPTGRNNWNIFIDGRFTSTWEYKSDSSMDAIEDYAFCSGVINLDDYEIIEDV